MRVVKTNILSFLTMKNMYSNILCDIIMKV